MAETAQRLRFRQIGRIELALSMAIFCLATVQPHLDACTPNTPNVLTGQYDAQRDSYNGSENCLTSSTVSTSTPLSQLARLDVDTDNLPTPTGYTYLSNPVYAQPLYVSGITASSPATTSNCNDGGTNKCNLIIGVTLNTTIFAWNATTQTIVWSREGGPTGKTAGTSGSALYYTDCTGGTVVAPFSNALPFVGILSTPVIDTSLTPPTMFLTSYCTDSSSKNHWYLHGIDLTTGKDVVTSGGNPYGIQIPECPASYGPNTGGWPTGSNGADDAGSGYNCTSGSNTALRFNSEHQNQRPALLKANSQIYIAFGTHAVENQSPASYPVSPESSAYHGWLIAYNRSLSTTSTPVIAFTTTAQGNSDGTQNSSSPNCDIHTNTSGSNYQNQPNWCGHGAGIWMSGHGPAASNGTLSDGYNHIFLGAGNGGFQQSANNWGQSVIDFRESSSTTNTSPFQSFTPHGGRAIGPNTAWSQCGCDSSGNNCNTTCSSFEVLNVNDWDMSVSGILLFDDPTDSTKHYLLTVDKAGYGYLLQQGNLCGGTPNSGLTQCNSSPQSYSSGDPGNIFAFLAPLVPCGSPTGTGPQNAECDRVTGLAKFYDGTNLWVYMWPNTADTDNEGGVNEEERLTAVRFNPGGTAIMPSGATVKNPGSDGTQVTGSSTYFTQWLIPGDSITANSQTVTVTTVTDDTHVTVSPAFSPLLTTATSLYSYSGYLVDPRPDFAPDPTATGYPGGALAVTSNSGSNGVLWSIIPTDVDSGQDLDDDASEYQRTQGSLWAYNAVPQPAGGGYPTPGLRKLWDSKNDTCQINGSGGTSCQTFCAAPYAVPTVVQGMVFVATYAINTVGDTTHLCPTDDATQPSYNSGILVFGLP